MTVTSSEQTFRPTYVVPPGDTIADLLEELEMTQTELARRLGVTLKHINQVVNGSASISAELALGLEKIFGVPAHFWLSRESIYRADLAKQSEAKGFLQSIEWAKRFPLRELKKRGYLPFESSDSDLVEALLTFFGVASPDIWQEPAAAYRKSQRYMSDPYALAAWLRVGEREATSIDCQPYSPERFLTALKQVRELTPLKPQQWQPRLVEFCAEAGVAVVIVDTFQGAKANGATRWLSPSKALIQLSIRYRWEDVFWFTFFHEAGHISLHRKKDMFVEGLSVEGGSANEASWKHFEDEADRFASRLLIPEENKHELRGLRLTDIPSFAKRLGIAPAIVVGQMQHFEMIRYNQGNDYRRRFSFSGDSETD